MNQKTQRERFEEAARELGCDEDEGRFDATVKKVAKVGNKGELTKTPGPESIGKGEKPKE